MEKLGVVMEDEKVKVAAKGGETCPACGTWLDVLTIMRERHPPRCPRCGSTELFEKR